MSYQLISYQLQRPFLPDHDIKILVSTADKLSADKLSADKLSADKLSADKLSADKLSAAAPVFAGSRYQNSSQYS